MVHFQQKNNCTCSLTVNISNSESKTCHWIQQRHHNINQSCHAAVSACMKTLMQTFMAWNLKSPKLHYFNSKLGSPRIMVIADIRSAAKYYFYGQ